MKSPRDEHQDDRRIGVRRLLGLARRHREDARRIRRIAKIEAQEAERAAQEFEQMARQMEAGRHA